MSKTITIQYISGFFDADGCITLSRNKANEHKTVHISFSNNERYILEEIKLFLLNQNIKSYIVKKCSKKKSHADSYSLVCQYKSAIKLCSLINSKHKRKIHRINCVLKYWNIVTMNNGKYSQKQLIRKQAFERLFFIR